MGIGSLRERAAEILDARSKEELLEACRTMAPDKLLWSYPSIRAYINDTFEKTDLQYEHPEEVGFDTSDYPMLDDWVERNVRHPTAGRGKSLILWGPTRLGKTLWSRSLGPHAYYGGLYSQDEPITEETQYAIFDDFGGLKYVPNYKFWLGHQGQFYATDKYKGKKLIKWGKPSIWLSNENPLDEFGLKDSEVEWLRGNCEIVEITTSIVHANSTCPQD